MAKAFSVLSWNVEHFGDDPSRVQEVVDQIRGMNPDVIGLYEVEGKDVYQALTTAFPGYTFQITEGSQTQEILVGVKPGLTAFITQKVEFKSGTTHMRPGALLSLKVEGVDYSLLFLHVASGADPRGMGLRDDMIVRAIEFRKVLDKAAGGAEKANYIFLGDLNTMGMDYPYGHDIPVADELKKADAKASRQKMVRLAKTHPASWHPNNPTSSLPASNLDHVFAARHLAFKELTGSNGVKAPVKVTGWVDAANDAAKFDWINTFSDHSILFFEVQKV